LFFYLFLKKASTELSPSLLERTEKWMLKVLKEENLNKKCAGIYRHSKSSFWLRTKGRKTAHTRRLSRHLDLSRNIPRQPWTSLQSFCHTHPWFDLRWSQHHPWCNMCWFSCRCILPRELAQTCVHKSPFQLHPSRHWLQSGWSCMLSSLRQWLQSSALHNWVLCLHSENLIYYFLHASIYSMRCVKCKYTIITKNIMNTSLQQKWYFWWFLALHFLQLSQSS